MYTCVIVDDQDYAIQVIEENIKKIPQLKLLKTFTDSIEAVEFLTNNSVDIAFLDVDMPDLNGFQIIEHLTRKQKSKLPSFMLITGHTEYALTGYDYDIDAFLVKPVDFNRFKTAIDRWLEKANNTTIEKEYFFIEAEGVKVKLNYKDIAYVESQGNWVEVIGMTLSKKIYKPMHYIESILCKNNNFIRVHKSFIVSVNYISVVKANEIEMSLGTMKKTISIGGTYKENVLKNFIN